MNQPDRDASAEVAAWPQAASGSISSNDVLSRIMLVLLLQSTRDRLRRLRLKIESILRQKNKKAAAAQLAPATCLH